MANLDTRLKAYARSLLQALARGSGLSTIFDRLDVLEAKSNSSQGTQILLSLLYSERAEKGQPPLSFDAVEFRVHSQNGEDGILLYLFSVLGTPTKRSLELCASDGMICNTANLIQNHGWRALLVDGDATMIDRARRFYRRNADTRWFPPTIVQSWVTADNVNDLVEDNGFAGDVDLVSLDMDGVDYWIWKALTAAQPLVVVAEYNWGWGPDESMTVPYDPKFVRDKRYYGASLLALTKLAREKGYRLVGTQSWGFNAFFVKCGVGEDMFPEVTPEQCFDTPVMRQRWTPEIRDDLRWRGEWVPV